MLESEHEVSPSFFLFSVILLSFPLSFLNFLKVTLSVSRQKRGEREREKREEEKERERERRKGGRERKGERENRMINFLIKNSKFTHSRMRTQVYFIMIGKKIINYI